MEDEGQIIQYDCIKDHNNISCKYRNLKNKNINDINQNFTSIDGSRGIRGGGSNIINKDNASYNTMKGSNKLNQK